LDATISVGGRMRKLREMVPDILAIATQGLQARNRRDSQNNNESRYLDPLYAIANGAPTQASYWLDRYNSAWNGDISRIWYESVI
jgi:glutamate--cysteine ligase